VPTHHILPVAPGNWRGAKRDGSVAAGLPALQLRMLPICRRLALIDLSDDKWFAVYARRRQAR